MEIDFRNKATIDTILEGRQMFLDALDKSNHITVKIQDDLDFDLSFLQLLYSAYKSAEIQGKKLEFKGEKGISRIITMRIFAGLPALPFEKVD